MSNPEQNLKNHARTDPSFHWILIPILLLNVVFFVIHFFHAQGWFNGWLIVLSIALLLLAFKARMYAVKVQDRIIRLEERLRLHRLAPDDFRGRIAELREGQLIALRFAGDNQVCALAAQALDEGLGGKEIKKRILNWRPDYFRV